MWSSVSHRSYDLSRKPEDLANLRRYVVSEVKAITKGSG